VIADLGSFAAAAQALHLAPPTISLHISELESRLDAKLMLRSKQGVQLTSAGAVLVQRGRLLLRDAEDAMAQVRRHARGLAGKVRLATQTGVLVYLLPQVLALLARDHPDIEVEVAVLGTHDTLAGIRAGQLDLGLISLPMPADAGLVCHPWRTDPMLACLPADWDAPAEVSPAWLADKPLIFNSSGTQLYRQTMAWFGQAGFSPSARIELNYTEAMKSLVVAGYGAAILPLESSEAPHALGLHERLQLRPLNPPLTRELALVHRPPDLLPPGALPVLEVLRGFGSVQPAL
jgi:DNA-binding transcriptional LysR family regulator